MNTFISFKRCIIAALTILSLLALADSPATAQQSNTNGYKQSLVVEEFTGTWCGYCPRGAWFMDSLQYYMGNNVVEICWHNNYSQPGNDDPNNGGDPMTIDLDQTNHVEDTIESYSGVTGFPSIEFQRSGAQGVNDWDPTDPTYLQIQAAAKIMPMVDYRLVNVAYDPNSHMLNADIDITPLDMTKMPKEGPKGQYRTVAVLTEDELAYDQHNYNLRGLPEWLTGFIHENVAREIGGKVLGDQFTLGTANPSTATLPVRIHYSMPVDINDWVLGNLRLKTFADFILDSAVGTKTYEFNNVLQAQASGYLTKYPQTPNDAIWIVLPNTMYSSKITATTNIVWATGGNASTSAKLEWSGDQGKTWNLIVANTTSSPYSWQVPQEAFGDSVMLRASDVSNPSTNNIVGSFATPGTIKVIHPAAGDVLVAGTVDSIVFTGGNIAELKNISYSLDSGKTWSTPQSISTNVNNLGWEIPATPTTAAFVKVTDGNGLVGISGQFAIKAGVVTPAGKFNSISLTNVKNDSILVNTQMTIVWSRTGNVGSNVTVEYSYENPPQIWNAISTVDSSKTSVQWTTPSTPYANVFIRVSGSAADVTPFVDATPFATYSTESVYSPVSLNGYSIANYPNPFSAETKISVNMPEAGIAVMTLRDDLGREVASISNGMLTSGQHEFVFNSEKLSAGIYSCTLEVNGVRLVKQMSLVK